MLNIQTCPRKDLGLLYVTGNDARVFLHAQSTQEINDLPATETRLAAWLSAKGRVRALFDVVPAGDSFWLITPADNIDWLAQQLSLFILRSDVGLEVVEHTAVYSLCGEANEWLSGHGIDLGQHGVVCRDDALWLRESPGCINVIAKPDRLTTAFAGLASCEPDRAVLAAIATGRPDMPATLRERYIPQMLNLQRLGAVSFNKGCYPGQEIVTRTEHRGSVKRSLQRYRIDRGARPQAGDAIVDSKGLSAGEINRVAASADGFELLTVVSDGTGSGELMIQVDSRQLERLALPSET